MKKFLVSLMTFLLVSFVSFGAAFAIPYTSTLEFHGEAIYSESVGAVAGAVVYDFDWNLPEPDQICDWYISVDVYAYGAIWPKVGDSYFFDVGPVTVADKEYVGTSDRSELDFIQGLIESLPNPWYDPDIGGYYLDGDWDEGTLWFGFYLENIACVENASAYFGGNLVLEANPVPEPATMLLLGSGLIGLGALGRKKFFKKA